MMHRQPDCEVLSCRGTPARLCNEDGESTEEGLPCAQIEAYPNQIEPVLDALSKSSAYSYDVLTYVLVERLASSGRDKLKADGLNIADWLQVGGRCPAPHADSAA